MNIMDMDKKKLLLKGSIVLLVIITLYLFASQDSRRVKTYGDCLTVYKESVCLRLLGGS